MSFSFTKKDDFSNLDPEIKARVPQIIINRTQEFEAAKHYFETDNLEEISKYCHNVRGVAACYGLYRLEEITHHIHLSVKSANLEELRDCFEILSSYFDSLK